MAYVSMFEGSHDVAYLMKVMDRCDQIFKIRDDRRAVEDEIRRRIVPAWSSTAYTGGKQYAWIVHAGMITYPAARCAYLIRRDPELAQRFGPRADGYVVAVEQTVNAFEDSWREDSKGSEGWYHGAYLDKGLPLNQQNALGRTLVALWLATGKDEYRAKAEKLATFFRRRLRRHQDGYAWSYWPDRGGAEDISHAAINVDFAFTCYRANIVFTRDDMVRFSQTLGGCLRGDGFAGNVDGTGDLRHSAQMGRWGHLGFVDPEVRRILQDHLRRNLANNSTAAMICAAYLVETRAVMVFDEVANGS